MGRIIRNGIEYGSGNENATNINYDNSLSSLEATTVQEAIDEVQENVNELNENLEEKVTYNDNEVCKIKAYGHFSGTATAGQCVKFGSIAPPEGASVILGVFLTPRANIKAGLKMYAYPSTDYQWDIFCESDAYSGNLGYNCLIVYK